MALSFLKNRIHIQINSNEVVFLNKNRQMILPSFVYLSKEKEPIILSIGSVETCKNGEMVQLLFDNSKISDLNYKLVQSFFLYGFQKVAKKSLIRFIRPDVFIQKNMFLKSINTEYSRDLFDAILGAGARSAQFEDELLNRNSMG